MKFREILRFELTYRCAVSRPWFYLAVLARIMQEIRIRVDWGPEKMP